MGFVVKDPKLIKTLQDIATELHLSLNEGSIVKQFNSSLNERMINSRLNELKIDNVLKASANKKQQTNTEIQQIKQETKGIKVKSDLLKEILSEDMITVVQQITSKPEMILDIAKGMQKIGKSQSIDNSTIEIGLAVNSGVSIQPEKRTVDTSTSLNSSTSSSQEDLREFERIAAQANKRDVHNFTASTSTPPPNDLHVHKLGWTATPTIFVGFFIKYAFFRK